MTATSLRTRLRRKIVPDANYHENRYAALLDACVRPGAVWLDLGAGTRIHGAWVGTPGDQLASRASLVMGADVVTAHLRRNPNLRGAAGAVGEHLPLRDASLDIVSANMVVEHLPDPERVLREIHRVLRPGGCFVLSTPNARHPVVRLSSLLLNRSARRDLASQVEGRKREHIFPTYYRCNTAGEIEALAARVGFEVPSTTLFNSFPFLNRSLVGVLAEGLLIKLTDSSLFEGFRSNILACLRKPVAAPMQGNHD